MKTINRYFNFYIPLSKTKLLNISLAKVNFVDEVQIILHFSTRNCCSLDDKWKNIVLLRWKKERENL
jgi:hypothetical protein